MVDLIYSCKIFIKLSLMEYSLSIPQLQVDGSQFFHYREMQTYFLLGERSYFFPEGLIQSFKNVIKIVVVLLGIVEII